MLTAVSANALGHTLRRWRRLNRVKQTALADDFRVSQATISRWESGDALPEPQQARRLTRLLTARPTAAADRVLLELVSSAQAPMHLVCDLTHQLLAASSARAAGWRVGVNDLIGTSLWRFATPGIAAGESELAARGWYDAVAPELQVRTEHADFDELTIGPGLLSYVRLPLADGGFARLVRDKAE